MNELMTLSYERAMRWPGGVDRRPSERRVRDSRTLLYPDATSRVPLGVDRPERRCELLLIDLYAKKG